MLSGVVVELSMDVFAIVICVLPDIGVDVLVNVNVNSFVVVMTVKFAMPAPSEGFSCGAAIDWWSMADLDCAHVLQARMPSYHV